MTSRNLELSLRTRAQTADLDKLIGSIDRLESAVRASQGTFTAAAGAADRYASSIVLLNQEEAKTVAQSARAATAVHNATAARERSAAAASRTVAAEAAAATAQERSAQASIRTQVATEQLAAAQSRSAVASARVAIEEQKIATARERTAQASLRTAREEANVEKARSQATAAAIRAAAAEERVAKARQGSGLAASIVGKQIAAFVTGGSAIVAGRQLIQFGKDSVQAAADAEQAVEKFNQVFRDLSGGMSDSLRHMAQVNKRSYIELQGLSAQLQNIFVSMGFARDAAADYTKEVLQLSIDTAAFHNLAGGIPEAVDRYTSALVGNHRAVRELGIGISEATLDGELMRMGMEDLEGEALEMAKVMGRYNLIMRATADAQGAAVREAETFTSQQAAMNAAVLEFKVAVGSGLIPAIEPLLVAMTDWLNKNREVGESIQELSNLIDLTAPIDQLVEDIGRIQDLRTQRVTSGNLGEQFANAGGNFGYLRETFEVIEAIALQTDSYEAFQAVLEELGITERRFLLDQALVYGIQAKTAEEFWETTRATNLYNRQLAYLNLEQQRANELLQAQAISLEQWTAAQNRATGAAAAFIGTQVQTSRGPGDSPTGLTSKDVDLALDWKEAWDAANETFADLFQNAPIDDIIQAQEDLSNATAGWEDELAAGRWIPKTDLTEIENAKQAVIDANQAVYDSYIERANAAIFAREVERGNHDAAVQFAVAAGIMTQAEADMRVEFVRTNEEIAAAIAIMEKQNVSMETQARVVKQIAAGYYETADAAIAAAQQQDELERQLGQYGYGAYGNIVQDIFGDQGSEPLTIEFIPTFATDDVIDNLGAITDALNDYDESIYEADVLVATTTATTEFDNLISHIDAELSKPRSVHIKVTADPLPLPGGGGGGSGGGGSTPVETGGPTTRGGRRGRSGPTGVGSGKRPEIVINQYGVQGENVGDKTASGVMQAARSMGLR